MTTRSSTYLRPVIALLCALLLGACHDESENSAAENDHPSTDVRQPTASSTLDRVNRTTLELTRRVETEQSLRLQAEARLLQQDRARAWWQNSATVLAVIAIAMLGVGAALGSAARHESEKA